MPSGKHLRTITKLTLYLQLMVHSRNGQNGVGVMSRVPMEIGTERETVLSHNTEGCIVLRTS